MGPPGPSGALGATGSSAWSLLPASIVSSAFNVSPDPVRREGMVTMARVARVSTCVAYTVPSLM